MATDKAQRAVDLEPNSATAYSTLAFILQHDLIGRRFSKGSDYNGAIAAFRKSLEIDPSDVMTRLNLAILLEHDAKGNRFREDSISFSGQDAAIFLPTATSAAYN